MEECELNKKFIIFDMSIIRGSKSENMHLDETLKCLSAPQTICWENSKFNTSFMKIKEIIRESKEFNYIIYNNSLTNNNSFLKLKDESLKNWEVLFGQQSLFFHLGKNDNSINKVMIITNEKSFISRHLQEYFNLKQLEKKRFKIISLIEFKEVIKTISRKDNCSENTNKSNGIDFCCL